jgi:hypothetical protein
LEAPREIFNYLAVTANGIFSVTTTLEFLAADCGRMTGNPEVMSSSVGLVPTNAQAVTDQSLERSGLPTANPEP